MVFGAVLPTMYALKLNYDNIQRLKFVFKRIGEIVVCNQNVNIRSSRKSVRFNLADFRAIEHHIQELRLFTNYAQEFRFQLRTARKSVFGGKRRSGNNRKLEICVREIQGRERRSR